jgi:hypothetical protein
LYPNDPKVLPPVTISQAALVKKISPELPTITRRVEQELLAYTKTTDTNIQSVIENPHVWLNTEYDDGETWAFVIGRNDNPDFGYHVEFKGTTFIEIWAGD